LGGLHGQKSIWHAHDLSWHTPRHAVAAHGLAMAHTKACRGKPWHPMGKPLTSVALPMGMPWQAVAHTKACRGLPMGMPLTSVCIAHGHATNLGLHCPWACHGKPWHTPRHAMAHTKACHDKPWHGPRHATTASRGTHQGMPWQHPMGRPWQHPMGRPWHTPRHAVAAHGLSWHTPRHAMASLGTPWSCHGTHQGMPRHTPRHAMAQIKACHTTHQGMSRHTLGTPALALNPLRPLA